VGLDVHKKTISYCVKDVSGRIHLEGTILATRMDLDRWMKTLPQPWTAAMEATIFSGWIYDHLKPHAAAVKVAHPLMLRAIVAAKKKNDRIDAHKIADCLWCDFLPESYMASPEIRERRRTLRYRNLLVRQLVQMKNPTTSKGYTRSDTSANCWPPMRTSMTDCGRCCGCATKLWFAWERPRALWCGRSSVTPCSGNESSA
jgi:hypothetical protein